MSNILDKPVRRYAVWLTNMEDKQTKLETENKPKLSNINAAMHSK